MSAQETVASNQTSEILCLQRLRKEALECLSTFPSKVVELNEIIEEYTPESVKESSNNANVSSHEINRQTYTQSTVSIAKEYKLPELDVSSSYTNCERPRVKHGVCKKRYYRMRASNGSSVRRHPGPLGQLLAFMVSRLALCTRKIVFAPSYFIIDAIVSIFFQRPVLKNAQCGPSINWNSSGSAKEKGAVIDSLIEIARPATVQLIADTTILKRWLQAQTTIKCSPLSTELLNATRTTETIDCWAYELFFHLKYLQVNRTQRPLEKDTNESGRKSYDDVNHLNLWHRMVQLRNNYIIMYETLNNRKIGDLASVETK